MAERTRTFNTPISLRLTEEQAERLERLHARAQLVSKHAIIRWCIDCGLATLEADPAKLLAAPAEPKKRKR